MPAFTNQVEKTEKELSVGCPGVPREPTRRKELESPRFLALRAGQEAEDGEECQTWPPGGDVWARRSSAGGEMGTEATLWQDADNRKDGAAEPQGRVKREGPLRSEHPHPHSALSPGNSWPEGNLTPAGHSIPPDKVVTPWPSQDSPGERIGPGHLP